MPKANRHRLSLQAGSKVEVLEADGSVLVTPVTERMPVIEEAGIRTLRDATRR